MKIDRCFENTQATANTDLNGNQNTAEIYNEASYQEAWQYKGELNTFGKER